jgi:hypothetical protein
MNAFDLQNECAQTDDPPLQPPPGSQKKLFLWPTEAT